MFMLTHRADILSNFDNMFILADFFPTLQKYQNIFTIIKIHQTDTFVYKQSFMPKKDHSEIKILSYLQIINLLLIQNIFDFAQNFCKILTIFFSCFAKFFQKRKKLSSNQMSSLLPLPLPPPPLPFSSHTYTWYII